jgi:gamma-glutamyltranspeptidase
VLGSAAIGSGLHSKTLQILSNILDFDMDPQTAADTPAFLLSDWSSWSPQSPHITGQVEKDTIASEVLDGVRSMGMTVNVLCLKTLPEGWGCGQESRSIRQRDACEAGFLEGRRGKFEGNERSIEFTPMAERQAHGQRCFELLHRVSV